MHTLDFIYDLASTSFFFFKSEVSEGQTATNTLKEKKEKKKVEHIYRGKNFKSNLIRHFRREKALLNPGTERLCQNTP